MPWLYTKLKHMTGRIFMRNIVIVNIFPNHTSFLKIIIVILEHMLSEYLSNNRPIWVVMVAY